MTRISAASNHFLMSMVTFFVVIIWIKFLWYPASYFWAAGAWEGLKIAALVDLVLGPLLTFIVFNSDKSKAKLIGDLVIIALLQISALSWGVHKIYQQRPVANVYWDWESAFFIVPANMLIKQGYDPAELEQYGEGYPVLIYAKPPVGKEAIQSLLDQVVSKKVAPHHQANLYAPLFPNFQYIKRAKIDLFNFMETEDDVKAVLAQIVREHGGTEQDYLFFPLYAKYQDLALVFKQTGEYVTTIHLRDKT